jgi:hypothetical protein
MSKGPGMTTSLSFHFAGPIAIAGALFVAGCGDSGTSGSGGQAPTSSTTATGSMTTSTGTGMPQQCSGTGAEITDLPACASNTSSPVTVPRGCEPGADGVLHADEWADGACFTAGDMTIVAKYGNDALFLAVSGQPTCGCPMGFYFNPDGTAALSGDEFALGLFDDPFGMDGDRTDFKLTGGVWSMTTQNMAISTRCPGNQPTPVRYEISLPFSTIGVTPGSAHDLGFAFVHAGVKWPAGLTVDMMAQGPIDPSNWGKLSSATWK